MTADGFSHEPVMVDDIVAVFAPVPEGTLLDATLGGGGHAEALLDRCPQLSVLGLDRDEQALVAAKDRLHRFGQRVTTVHSRFDRLAEVMADSGIDHLSGALFDLGVSSPQLDRAERGFSYRNEGPLDMRMDGRRGQSAADVVNGYSETQLAHVLREYGDERFAGRIARAIVAARPISTTTELAAIVSAAIPAATRRTGGHPAKRTFQALRIEVNSELEQLPAALDQAIDATVPDRPGRRVDVSLRRGPTRQATLHRSLHGFVHVSAGVALRLRSRRCRPPGPRSAYAVGGAGRAQPARPVRSAACGREARDVAVSALPMRRIDAPRRRPPGSRQARTEQLGRFGRRRLRRPMQRRDGYAGVAEAVAELEQIAELRVVPRRRLAANFAALALVLLGVLMLSAVVLHTRLAERQRQIDQLEQQVEVQHELFDILRQQRAVLRSPTRLASESARLGMFAPPDSNFVAVDPWALAQIIATTGTAGSLDGLLVDGDALDQVMRVRAAVSGQ